MRSPCIKRCGLGDDGRCVGCRRTADEVARWRDMSETEREAIMARQPGPDPVETVVREALLLKGIDFVTEMDPRAKRLDFYLVDFGVHVEVKQFHTPRIAEQMSRADDVIAVQGMTAARLFARMIKGDL